MNGYNSTSHFSEHTLRVTQTKAFAGLNPDVNSKQILGLCCYSMHVDWHLTP